MNEASESPAQAPEQLVYARLLERGTHIGLFLLVAGFVVYIAQWLTPHVPLEQLPALWSYPVEKYLEATASPTGWGWVLLIHRGDVASTIGIVVLASVSAVCLAALVPLYRQRGDRAFAALCIAECIVVLGAASGLLAGH